MINRIETFKIYFEAALNVLLIKKKLYYQILPFYMIDFMSQIEILLLKVSKLSKFQIYLDFLYILFKTPGFSKSF